MTTVNSRQDWSNQVELNARVFAGKKSSGKPGTDHVITGLSGTADYEWPSNNADD